MVSTERFSNPQQQRPSTGSSSGPPPHHPWPSSLCTPPLVRLGRATSWHGVANAYSMTSVVWYLTFAQKNSGGPSRRPGPGSRMRGLCELKGLQGKKRPQSRRLTAS
eukprot:428722-Pelagomonas_calceolata.AAC.2